MPIIQTATYAFADTADLVNFMQQRSLGTHIEGREDYGRYGNPTVQSVERKVAALERADDAVLFSSGMAAMTTLLLASLPTGAHLVMTDDCYRRTRQFCLVFLKRLGIETTVVPMGDYAALEAAIQPKRTRFLISESPTNPYLRCVDLGPPRGDREAPPRRDDHRQHVRDAAQPAARSRTASTTSSTARRSTWAGTTTSSRASSSGARRAWRRSATRAASSAASWTRRTRTCSSVA